MRGVWRCAGGRGETDVDAIGRSGGPLPGGGVLQGGAEAGPGRAHEPLQKGVQHQEQHVHRRGHAHLLQGAHNTHSTASLHTGTPRRVIRSTRVCEGGGRWCARCCGRWRRETVEASRRAGHKRRERADVHCIGVQQVPRRPPAQVELLDTLPTVRLTVLWHTAGFQFSSTHTCTSGPACRYSLVSP